jgi:hypothetical protein
MAEGAQIHRDPSATDSTFVSPFLQGFNHQPDYFAIIFAQGLQVSKHRYGFGWLTICFRIFANEVGDPHAEQLGKLKHKLHRRVCGAPLLQIEHMGLRNSNRVSDLLKGFAMREAQLMKLTRKVH